LLHAGLATSLALPAHAQPAASYPAKPVRVIVPFPAGGGLDLIARPVAQRMSENTKQPFVMEYRGGANGIVGTEAFAKTVPDGYTLLAATTGVVTINPNVHAKLPFDPLRDLLPISNLGEAPFVLVCHPTLAVRNPRELIALAKSRQGELNYGSPGVGGINHLGMELFLQLSGGLKLLHVTYKGSTPLLIDVMGGHVLLAFDSIQATSPHITNRRLRALGIGDHKRSPVAPDIPTIAEGGGPAGYQLISWYGLFAPGGTSPDIVARAHAETVKALASPDIRERMAATGATPIGNTPAEFATVIKADLAKWAKVVKVANVKVE
jgi:tripartite-type tricarboxylate transporter receptor subunit TctC